VTRQLERGEVRIVFDPETDSVDIQVAAKAPPVRRESD
jgi:uncharacterized protein YheU (UPF0270 family)